MEFLWRTLLGLGGVLIFLLVVAVFAFPFWLVGCGVGKVRKKNQRFDAFCKRSGPVIGGTLLTLFLGGIVVFLLVGIHDMGCELRGHPGHKILSDGSKPHSH